MEECGKQEEKQTRGTRIKTLRFLNLGKKYWIQYDIIKVHYAIVIIIIMSPKMMNIGRPRGSLKVDGACIIFSFV